MSALPLREWTQVSLVKNEEFWKYNCFTFDLHVYRLILNWHIGRVRETGLRVQWTICSPKTNSYKYGNLGPRFQVSLLLREPLPPCWIFNSPPDWLKITSAILDLENKRVCCSRNNSLLSISAPDLLRLIWACYSSSWVEEKMTSTTH